jgi:hypothetical protein
MEAHRLHCINSYLYAIHLKKNVPISAGLISISPFPTIILAVNLVVLPSLLTEPVIITCELTGNPIIEYSVSLYPQLCTKSKYPVSVTAMIAVPRFMRANLLFIVVTLFSKLLFNEKLK